MKETPAAKLRNATHEGDLQSVKSLIPLLDSKKRREQLTWALWAGVREGHLPVVNCLLDAGANPNAKGLMGSLLMVAAGFGHLPVVKRLIGAGADIHAKVSGENVVSRALSCDKPEIAKYLQSLGVDWATPTLLYAARKGNLARVKEALAAGANINAAMGPEGETSLMLAAHNGRTDVARYLLKSGANPNLRIKEWTALILAAGYGKNLETVNALVEAGADIHAKHYDETVLMFASQGGRLPIVKRLVELGADVQARDKHHGKTALDYAKDGKHKEVIAYLNTLGLAAERDPGRAFVRVLAREFGGKPVEHVHGFMLNAKFAGNKCQFHVTAEANGVVVFKLNYVDAELRHARRPGLVMGGDRPDPRQGRTGEAKAAGRLLGIPVWRLTGENEVPERFATSFCDRHKERLKQLALSGKEQVRIAGESAGFFWDGTDTKTMLPRLKSFASLLQDISRPPQSERRLMESEWLLKPAPKSSKAGQRALHSLGGIWPQPVACPNCGTTTNLMAQIDLSDPVLPKTSFGRGRLPVFWCLTCLEWDAAFFDLSSPVPKPIPTNGRKSKSGRIEAGQEDLEEQHVRLTAVPVGRQAGRKSKLGGSPAWIQLEATPDCPKCKRRMTFVLQLASDSHIAYSDMGLLYAFACPDCRITASLIQSH